MFGKYDFVSRAQSVLTLLNARTYCQISSCHVPWGTGRVVLHRTSDRACQHEDTLSHSQRGPSGPKIRCYSRGFFSHRGQVVVVVQAWGWGWVHVRDAETGYI